MTIVTSLRKRTAVFTGLGRISLRDGPRANWVNSIRERSVRERTPSGNKNLIGESHVA